MDNKLCKKQHRPWLHQYGCKIGNNVYEIHSKDN